MDPALQLYQQALAAYHAGDWGQARQYLKRSLAIAPQDPASLLLLGVAQEPQDFVAGLCLVEQSVMRDPANAVAWYNLGVLEAERANFSRAIACYARCISIDPTHVHALGNGCELLRRTECFEEALVWARTRLSLSGQDWRDYLHCAVCLYHLQRFPEAHEAFAQAHAHGEGAPIIAWEHSSLLLREKRFGEAWDAFEHRFAVGHLTGVFHYPFTQPLWRGEDLSGKHILVHNEQGLGDQIMFACALGEVVEAASATTIVVAPTLASVFAASFPKARVLPAKFGAFAGDHPEPDWIATLGPVDYQAPIGSLMVELRRDAAAFAHPKPYLRPSDEARARWRAFDPGPGLKVGLCWASNPALFRQDSAARAVKKSMALENLAPLATVSGARFVSVLNWPLANEEGAFARVVSDVSARLTSFDETAALIERLDVIITVDTSVAHMAGALGKETWLLLHDFADSRWSLNDSTSYWYPNMRLFRQPRLGAWGPVVEAVKDALHQRACA